MPSVDELAALVDTHARVLGAGNVDVNAGELIDETVHALEMSADAEDIGLTIHPHPTLSEAIGFAAEAAEGTITDSAWAAKADSSTSSSTRKCTAPCSRPEREERVPRSGR